MARYRFCGSRCQNFIDKAGKILESSVYQEKNAFTPGGYVKNGGEIDGCFATKDYMKVVAKLLYAMEPLPTERDADNKKLDCPYLFQTCIILQLTAFRKNLLQEW